MRGFTDPAKERRLRRLAELEQAADRGGDADAASRPEPLPEDRLVGVVDSVDEDVATVLVGADEVEYVFPLSLLPEGAAAGMMLYLVLREGRLEVLGERTAGKAELGGAVQDRLERGLSRRRLRDLGITDTS